MNNKRILFITNYPSPYRVDFWNLWGKQVELTVIYTASPEEQHHRSLKWFKRDYSGFRAIFLNEKIHIHRLVICRDIFPILKQEYDLVFLGGYSDGTQMAAIEYLRFHKIPFVLEADGGLIRNDTALRRMIKRHFIGSASAWMSSGKSTTEYLVHYGADPSHAHFYPFTSLWQADLDNALKLTGVEKNVLRNKLGMTEDKIVISVGRFSYKAGYGKGYDTLCCAASMIDQDIGIYVIGDEPTEEFKQLKEKQSLVNVHFVGFRTKEALEEYYAAADVFVLLTRDDIWGLVINEAMAFGLPVITTDRCGAGLSLIEEGVNGYIIPTEDPKAVKEKIELILSDGDLLYRMRLSNLSKIREYTIENMVDAHMRFLNKQVEVGWLRTK